MALSAGSDIESICSKCGDVWHVIVAMVGEKIAKVQCKECNGLHRYRPSGDAAIAAKAAKAAKTTRTRKTTGKTAAPAKSAGPMVEVDVSRPTRPYKASEQFEVTERVDHIKFGIGVVEEAIPGKITVWFPVGRKILVQAKSGSAGGLARPKPFAHEEAS